MGEGNLSSTHAVTAVATGIAISGISTWLAFRYWAKKPTCPNAPVSDNPVKHGFSTKAVPSDLDVIVIGSGMGGLATAVLLAKEGKKVLVLEQHDIAGGNLHTFEEKGYEFDTGLHYIGGRVGDKQSTTRKLFDYVTDGQVEWARMDDPYDVAMLRSGEEQFNIYSNWTKLKEHLEEKFPEESKAIEEYFELVNSTAKSFGLLSMLKLLPESLFKLSLRMFDGQLGVFKKTTAEVLSSLTSNSKLSGVLSYMYGDYGESPGRGAFAMNALIATHYKSGAYYPVEGPLKIAKSAAHVIEKWGGKILVRAPVTSILIDDKNRAFGVEVKGKKIFAKTVVSSVGMPKTFRSFVPKSHRNLVQWHIDQIGNENIASNISLMSMFVGINDPDNSLHLPKCNYWIHRSWNHEENMAEFRKDHNKVPLFFISFSSAKDPTYASRHPGKQVALVIGPGDYNVVERFKNDRVKHRGKEYEALKKEWENLYMDALLNQFPDLKGKVDFVDFGSAVTNDFYLGTYRGAVYGLAHTPDRLLQHWLRPRTPIKNLFLTGQDICVCGVFGALMGGYQCAYAISPKSFFHTIHLHG
ncbi:hypothetical protein ACHAXS_013338 [Conticribra weissflogii]